MSRNILKDFSVFLLFCAVQVLVLNRIQLFGCATPFPYIVFVLMFPRSCPKWAVLLWSFSLGLAIDMFSNTPGVTSASLTLIGAIQPYMLSLFVPRDADEDMSISAKNLGWGKFSTYAILCVTLYTFIFFTIEAFNLLNWTHWLQCVIGSAILTALFILAIENVRK